MEAATIILRSCRERRRNGKVVCYQETFVQCPNLTLLTLLFKRAYQGRTFTGTQEQFWPDALPAATNDSYGYHWTQVQWAQVHHLNHWATSVPSVCYRDNRRKRDQTGRQWLTYASSTGKWMSQSALLRYDVNLRKTKCCGNPRSPTSAEDKAPSKQEIHCNCDYCASCTGIPNKSLSLSPSLSPF